MQSSSTFLMRSLATITSLDARAIAYQEPLVITTPNMDWIPELHNDDSELRARADGHFGLEDCFQWPQKYCKQFEYAVCIPRKETSSIDLQFAWYTPTTNDFVTQAGTAFAIGTLDSVIVNGIDNFHTIYPKLFSSWQAAVLPAELLIRADEGTNFGWPYAYYDQFRKKNMLQPGYGGDGKTIGKASQFTEPMIGFPGHWVYIGDTPVIHIAEWPTYSAHSKAKGKHVSTQAEGTGPVDHIAFGAQDYDGVLERIRKHGVPVRENNNPGNIVRQLFLFDPNGVQIEINFRK